MVFTSRYARRRGRGRVRLVLGLLGTLCLALVAAAAPAYADMDDAVRSLSGGPGVYVDDAAADLVSAADLRRIEQQIADADAPIFLAILPDTSEVTANSDLTLLAKGVGRRGVYTV